MKVSDAKIGMRVRLKRGTRRGTIEEFVINWRERYVHVRWDGYNHLETRCGRDVEPTGESLDRRFIYGPYLPIAKALP